MSWVARQLNEMIDKVNGLMKLTVTAFILYIKMKDFYNNRVS